jgi:hypothetical protein
VRCARSGDHGLNDRLSRYFKPCAHHPIVGLDR